MAFAEHLETKGKRYEHEKGKEDFWLTFRSRGVRSWDRHTHAGIHTWNFQPGVLWSVPLWGHFPQLSDMCFQHKICWLYSVPVYGQTTVYSQPTSQDIWSISLILAKLIGISLLLGRLTILHSGQWLKVQLFAQMVLPIFKSFLIYCQSLFTKVLQFIFSCQRQGGLVPPHFPQCWGLSLSFFQINKKNSILLCILNFLGYCGSWTLPMFIEQLNFICKFIFSPLHSAGWLFVFLWIFKGFLSSRNIDSLYNTL